MIHSLPFFSFPHMQHRHAVKPSVLWLIKAQGDGSNTVLFLPQTAGELPGSRIFSKLTSALFSQLSHSLNSRAFHCRVCQSFVCAWTTWGEHTCHPRDINTVSQREGWGQACVGECKLVCCCGLELEAWEKQRERERNCTRTWGCSQPSANWWNKATFHVISL